MSNQTRDPAERAVAVVGVGAMLPDAPNAPAFWENVASGRDCISEVPRERWDVADYYDPDPKATDKTYSKIGGWVRGFQFDPTRYRIPPKVASEMDQGQHWMVVAAAETLKDCGHPDRPLDLENTAVIVGNAMGGERHYITTSRLFAPEFHHALEATPSFRALPVATQKALLAEFTREIRQRLPEATEDTMPGELANIMAGRVAAVFNLRGPNFTSDAACASSFAALQAAIDGLVDHHYDSVISGGMDRNMGASTFVKFCKIGALSPDGSRPYAKGANGFVMGEGGALFMLKRIEDAEKAGDRIYAIIRSVGASSDGKGKSITAPNPAGQILAVRRAWQRAGLDPATMSLIEGHGTSTAVGDVAEMSAIAQVLEGSRLPKKSLPLGSIKSQIGHLKAGAGAAGLLKAVYALHHKIIPPSINWKEPNPNIDWDKTPFRVPTKAEPWERPAGSPRRVGVSAFGFGGTNFHVVLEEYVPGMLTTSRKSSAQVPAAIGGAHGGPVMGATPIANLALIGAPDVGALRTELTAMVARARSGDVPPRKAPGPEFRASRERIVISFETPADLVKLGEAALTAFDKQDPRSWRLLQAKGIVRGTGPATKVAFLYPGQGSQYVNMLSELRKIDPVVVETFAEADRVMKPILGKPLTDYLFVDSKDPAVLAKAEDELRATVITQPAVLACDVALTRLLARFGVTPDLVMGHSLGEWAALVAAGMLPFADALVAVSSRARGMASVAPPDPGKMASVLGPYEEIAKRLAAMDGYVVAANLNSKNQTVIAGETDAVLRAVEQFKQAGFTAQTIPVSHAFHSKIVAAASGPLRKVLESAPMRPPQIPIVSNVDGELYPSDLDKIRDQLSVQLASPVQWVKSLETAYREGVRVLVEVGPKRVLRGLAEDLLGDRQGVVCLSTNHPKRGDILSFHEGLCGLYAAGWPREQRPTQTSTTAASIDVRTALAVSSGGPNMSAFVPPGASAPRASDSLPGEAGATDYPALGKLFARFLEEGLSLYRGTGAPAPRAPSAGGAPVLASPGTDPAAFGSVVISGGGIGLPGKARRMFDDANVSRILAGETFFDPIPEDMRKRILDKNIVRLVKREVGEPSMDAIKSTEDVIKLAARRGAFDLAAEYGIDANRADAFDVTTAMAIAAGIEAIRDAGIPLVRHYRRTTTGSRLPDRWLLPRCYADETGIIFSSAFPALNRFAEDLNLYHADQLKRAIIEELAGIAKDNPQARKRIAELEAELSRESYAFDRRFLFRTLAMGHAQFAEIIGARGPNTLINSACASATQAIGIASDWIKTGRCRRVVVMTADDTTSDQLLEWVGAGFLSTGAATTEARVDLAALPFDRRRNGMLLGMGAAAVVLETEDAVRERGMRGIVEVLASESANSAFHGTRLDVEHIGEVMDRMMETVERSYGVSRTAMAREMMFMSHETYTPARGGSASAEVHALKRTFGDAAGQIVVANTKGYTGHPMGVGIEDVVALKALETQIVPPVPNFLEADPELGTLNLSRGGHYPVNYALRFAAGFGSQLSLTLTRRVPGCENRVRDAAVYEQWLASVTGYAKATVEVDHRTLRVRDLGAPEREPIGSSWIRGSTPAARVLPLPSEALGGGSSAPRETPAVAPTPAMAAPAPAITAASAQAVDTVAERVLGLVSEKTGYPRDMLDLELDLEADLGIDTVKQAEVFALVRETFDIPRQDNVKLRDYPTLKHVIGFVRQYRPELAAAPTASTPVAAAAPAAATTPAGADEVAEKVLTLVSEKTGYPRDMLDLELDLEADLGIDTVKQAEVFALVRDTFDIPRQDNVKLRDYPTLKHVIGFVHQYRPELAVAAAAAPAPAPAATPATPPSASSAAAGAAGQDEITEKVLAVVSEKTGYPPDMLELDLDLEADLGIDTVKQAEVFALVRETFDIPRQDSLKLRDYPTLKHVIGYVHQYKPATAAASDTRDEAKPAESQAAASPAPAAGLLRIPVPVLRPALELCKPTAVRLSAPMRILVVSDKGGAGSALIEQLKKRRIDVTTLDDKLSVEDATARTAKFIESGEVGGVYFLTGLDASLPIADIEPAAWQELHRRQVKLLCGVTRALYETLGHAGTFLVTATRLGGLHGYEPAGASSPVGGAITGFTKTIARERSSAVVKAVDFEAGASGADIARALIAETERDPEAYEVGHKGSARFAIGAIEQDRALVHMATPMKLDEHRVFVVTGGAGAITSAIVQDLARASRATFHLLDLLPTPDDGTQRDVARMATDKDGLKRDIFEKIKSETGRATPAQVDKRLFELERSQAILDTVKGVEAAGGKAFYHSVDVTSADGMAKAIDAVVKQSKRIDVILHTAGLERSRTFDTKPQEEFDRVYGVKVEGLYNLMRATRKVDVGALVCFSSVAGRFGNPGQADYSAANDLMCKVTSSFRAAKPGAIAVAFDWSAWGGIGMATRGSIPEMMRRAGIEMLDPNEATPLVRQALTSGMSSEAVVGRALGILLAAKAADGGLDENAVAKLPQKLPMADVHLDIHAGIETKFTLDPKKEAFLYDHQIDGTPVLPGVMGLEAFAEVAAMLAPGHHVRAIENVRFQAPLKYYRSEPRTATIRALPMRDADGTVRVACSLSSSQAIAGGMTKDTVHFLADVVLCEGKASTASADKANGSKTAKKGKPGKAAAPALGSIDREAIYRVYFHGPAYQVLSGVELRPDGSVAGTMAGKLPADHGDAAGAWLFAPRLVELCFQTAGVYEIGLTGRMGLPAGVEKVIVHETPAPGTVLVAEIRPAKHGGNGSVESLRFEAQVRGESGRPYVELIGYRTSTMPGGLAEPELAPFRAVALPSE